MQKEFDNNFVMSQSDSSPSYNCPVASNNSPRLLSTIESFPQLESTDIPVSTSSDSITSTSSTLSNRLSPYGIDATRIQPSNVDQPHNQPSNTRTTLSRAHAMTVSAIALSDMLRAMVFEHQQKGGYLIDYELRDTVIDRGLSGFIERMGNRLRCSYSCYLMGTIYIQRLLATNPGLYVSAQHINHLYGTGVIIAAKFIDDIYYTNKFYSSVCQIQLSTFNDLEKIFTSLAGFAFCVSTAEFKIIREKHFQRQFQVVQRNDYAILQRPISQRRRQQDRDTDPAIQQSASKMLQSHLQSLQKLQLSPE